MVTARVSILLAAVVTPALAFWRMECRGVTGYQRIDPLISPGKASEHIHALLGSGGLSQDATSEDLMSSNCTSCLVTQDKSAYWHPALYFQDSDTGEFELVEQVGGTLAYYLLYTGNGNSDIKAFPKDFRMIAGDNKRRSFTVGNVEMEDPPKSSWASLKQTTQDDLKQRAIGFNCLDYGKTPEGSLYRHFLPDKKYLDANCKDGIRIELMFPSCWNGKDTDSANHQDHMAYPDLVMTGDCPSDFPVRVPSLFYETIWNTNNYTSRNGNFVLSNGDVEGFAYHGDFMMGWDEGFLQQAINTCTNPSGRIEDCPLFNIQSPDDANSCKVKTPANVVSDKVDGPAKILPGDISTFGSYIGVSLATYDPAAAPSPTGYGGGGSTTAASVSGTPSVPGTPGVTATTSTTGAAGVVQAPAVELSSTSSVSASVSAPRDVTVTATPGTMLASSSLVVPSASSSKEAMPPAYGTPQGTAPGYGFPKGTAPGYGSPKGTAPTYGMPSMSKPPTRPTPDTADVFSTQYITDGDVVTEILWEATTVTVAGDARETVVVKARTDVPHVVRTRRNMQHRPHNHMERHAEMRRRRALVRGGQ